MIPRTLVPVDARLHAAKDGAAKPAARRLSSTLDLRTIVPRDLPIKPLDGDISTVPSHVPFDVIVGRQIVDKNWHLEPRNSSSAPARRIETSLDERSVVPAIVEPPTVEEREKLETMPPLTADLLDVIEPDVMTTGDVNLLISPREERDDKWNTASRFVSLFVHVGIILLALSSPDLFKRNPSQADIDTARQMFNSIYIPTDAIPRSSAPPAPKVHINPDVIRKVAPPSIPSPVPAPIPSTPRPTPEPPKKDLPAALTPRTTPTPAQPQTNSNAASPIAPIKPDTPQPGKLNLAIPNSSPGKALQNSIEDAINHGGGTKLYSDGRSYGGGGGGGGGGGQGETGAIQMLTPTQGVDFSQYLQRVLDSVRRNWYAIIPESARMGDKGIVVIQFKIERDGIVPNTDPRLMRTSGKEPLDRAAMSSIRASSPFEPLPSQFNGPEIELRFIFLYNLPLDYYQ
jgi:TonB family protein